MAENKMEQIESLLIWLASGEKDEDGNWLSDNDTQLICDALEYYLNMHGQQNKMEQVAKLFDKKLNEPFIAYELGKSGNHNHISITSNGELIGNHVMFSERGVVYVDAPEDKQDWLLIRLLTGEAEIVGDKK